MDARCPTPPYVVSQTCGRCGKVHNGAQTPPGWSTHPRHGLVCDDCDETLSLAAQVGAPGIAA